jgi:putative transposase
MSRTAPSPADIRDLCNRTAVGWSMGERQPTDLVVASLVVALGRRNPSCELLHHADHGCRGEVNRSSQHLTMTDAAGGLTTADGGQGASALDELELATLRWVHWFNEQRLHSHCDDVHPIAELPDHHRDPFDQMLACRAQHERFVLVSKDRVFTKYDVELVW